MIVRLLAAPLALACSACVATQHPDAPKAPDPLADAIAEMRDLPDKLVGREAEERGPRIQAAWNTLIRAGGDGAAALLAEAARLDAAGRRDDRFRLGAAAVVWQIGHFERVADVVTLWGDADFSIKYGYAFAVAFEAARDGDERCLPLLVALLRDQRGTYGVTQHVMELHWPLTHFFLWGPMGRKALPPLTEVLATADDPTTVSSAVTLLADAWDTTALPRLREIARAGPDRARRSAIRALGSFGHPDDFDFLCAGLGDADPDIATAHVAALCRFGDLSAVSRLTPLTEHTNESVRLNALQALGVLATVDGLAVFAERVDALEEEQSYWFAQGPSALHSTDVTWDTYRELDRPAQQAALQHARDRIELEFGPWKGDRRLSHAEFERLCAAWIDAARIDREDSGGIEARHLLAIATPADVPLLLDLRGRLCRRLSDECLEEIAFVDGILERLVRGQYRKEPGQCARVEPIAPKHHEPK